MLIDKSLHWVLIVYGRFTSSLLWSVVCTLEYTQKQQYLIFAVSFQRVWRPILAMEAASKTTQSGEPILCNGVPVSLVKRNDKYYGKLHLPLEFCKKRCIQLFNNSKDGEDDVSDYLCLRCHTGQVSDHTWGSIYIKKLCS